MLNNISREQSIAIWVAGVIVVMACSLLAGAAITIGSGALWLVAAVVPPAVMVLLWHGEPPLTVRQMLAAVDKQSPDGRP
jgi:hypothetical protein